jgi:anti-anti-sigma factor
MKATLLPSRRSPAPDTVSVGRRLDAPAARRIARAVARLSGERVPVFTIDMAEIESADSAGFGGLVMALRNLEQAHTHAIVVCSNPAIRKLFELASVKRLANVVPRLEEARALQAALASGLAS